MKKRWIQRSGPVPGTGESHIHTTDRPDTPELVSKAQIAERLGVSNKAVIRPALENLRIEPVDRRRTTHDTYRNGGSGHRVFKVEWYGPSAVDHVRAELKRHAQATGRRRHGCDVLTYAGKSFFWEEVLED